MQLKTFISRVMSYETLRSEQKSVPLQNISNITHMCNLWAKKLSQYFAFF